MKVSHTVFRLSLLAVASLFTTSSALALVYRENISGDLSSNHLAPTPLTFDVSVNRISGTMGGDPGEGIPLDRDFFKFTLAPGQALTSINVLQFDPQGQSFYAISGGPTIGITSPADHLSNVLVTGLGEILDDLDNGSYSGGLGLTAPLQPGTYTVWFQELASVVTYDFAYTVTSNVAPVPEPGTAIWGAALGISLALRRCRLRTGWGS